MRSSGLYLYNRASINVMSFTIGTRLDSYEIVGFLGAGGMGDVYRARDSRLNRDVAIKALPEAFASDPDRLARFQREAQVLASLNHPNIGVIYDIHENRGTRFLVLELVEGETLDARLKRGPIEVDEALEKKGSDMLSRSRTRLTRRTVKV